jgi:hypothetical protein
MIAPVKIEMRLNAGPENPLWYLLQTPLGEVISVRWRRLCERPLFPHCFPGSRNLWSHRACAGTFHRKDAGRKDAAGNHAPGILLWIFGVGLAWQVAFLIIARDPQRFRPIIPAAMLEKFSYAIACAVLFALGRVPMIVVAGGAGDLVLGVLFTMAYFRLKQTQPAQ